MEPKFEGLHIEQGEDRRAHCGAVLTKENLLGDDPAARFRQYECPECGYFMCMYKPTAFPDVGRTVNCLYERKEHHTSVRAPWKNGTTMHRIWQGDDARLHDELHRYEFGDETDVMVEDVLFTKHGPVDHEVGKGEVMVLPREVVVEMHEPLPKPSEELLNGYDTEESGGRSLILDESRAARYLSYDSSLYQENRDGMVSCDCQE